MITAEQIRNNFEYISVADLFRKLVIDLFSDFRTLLQECLRYEQSVEYDSNYTEKLRKLNDYFIEINDALLFIIGEDNIKLKHNIRNLYVETDFYIDGKWKFSKINSKVDYKTQSYISIIPYYNKYMQFSLNDRSEEINRLFKSIKRQLVLNSLDI